MRVVNPLKMTCKSQISYYALSAAKNCIDNLPSVLRAALVKVMASGIAREAVGTLDILVFTGPEEILNQFEIK